MRERFISEREIDACERDHEVSVIDGRLEETVDQPRPLITFGFTRSPLWIGALAVCEAWEDFTAEDAAAWVANRYGRNVQLHFPRLRRSITIRPWREGC